MPLSIMVILGFVVDSTDNRIGANTRCAISLPKLYLSNLTEKKSNLVFLLSNLSS